MSTNILLRSAGSPLKWGELDQNFTNLRDSIEKLNGSIPNKYSNGYAKFGNGILMQWGTAVTTNGRHEEFNFNVNFNHCAILLLSEANGKGWEQAGTSLSPTIYGKIEITSSKFKINAVRITKNSELSTCSNGLNFIWLALGV